MIDFTDIDDKFEHTQRLPLLTTEVQLEEALNRERAARIEVVELIRQNIGLVKDLARLRHEQRLLAEKPPALPADQHLNTEAMLFEVCGALKDALFKVLAECQSRGLPLECGTGARHTLDDACEKLERTLSDAAIRTPAAMMADATPPPVAAEAAPSPRTHRFLFTRDGLPTTANRPARPLRLHVVRSDSHP